MVDAQVLPFVQVDAFTTVPFAGNPCAVVFDAGNLSDEVMLAIAREMNLAETAFVQPSEVADVRARYFTPAEEIPLAGHPTIATVHALLETGRLRLPPRRALRLELQAGVIEVGVRRKRGAPRCIVMSQLPPVFGATYEAAEVLAAFRLPPEAALPGALPQTVSTGTPMLMVPLRDVASLKRAQLDVSRFVALKARGDFFSPHLFCLGGFTPAGDTAARHFGVPPDLPEDPFTGSATGSMAAYLWRQGLISTPTFVAEQGHAMGRPGTAHVEVVGPPHEIRTVRVAGHAVLVLEGTLRL